VIHIPDTPTKRDLEQATAALARSRRNVESIHRVVQFALVILGGLAGWGLLGDINDLVFAASVGLVIAGFGAAVYLEATVEFYAAQVTVQATARKLLAAIRGSSEPLNGQAVAYLRRSLWALRGFALLAAGIAIWMVVERASKTHLAVFGVAFIVSAGVMPTLLLIWIEKIARRFRG
jgi:lipoprotein signal peptidase